MAAAAVRPEMALAATATAPSTGVYARNAAGKAPSVTKARPAPASRQAGAWRASELLGKSLTSSVQTTRQVYGRRHLTVAASADGEENGVIDVNELQDLIRLVNSSDIVELELKNSKFEMLVRKKEALVAASAPAASGPAPAFPSYPMFPPGYGFPPPAPAPALPAAAPAAAPAEAAPAAPAAPTTSDLPTVLCPMAGTFYRSPAPGEPSFVEVGSKVTKGQPICIVEAMKLMNEIEAEVSGTIVEILCEDAKPVTVNQPLFRISPA